MKDQWNIIKRPVLKPKDSWGKPTTPPVPMPIIMKRALQHFELDKQYPTKLLYRMCKKLNKNVNLKMFRVCYTRWLLSGEGFEPWRGEFVRVT